MEHHDGMNNGEPPVPRDSRLSLYAEAHEVGMQSVRDHRRSLSLDGATEIVTDAFQVRGLVVEPTAARSAARLALDPRWPWKHPIRAHRAGWRIVWPWSRTSTERD
jgi:hypothetical protein